VSFNKLRTIYYKNIKEYSIIWERTKAQYMESRI